MNPSNHNDKTEQRFQGQNRHILEMSTENGCYGNENCHEKQNGKTLMKLLIRLKTSKIDKSYIYGPRGNTYIEIVRHDKMKSWG